MYRVMIAGENPWMTFSSNTAKKKVYFEHIITSTISETFFKSLRAHYNIIPPNLMNIFYIIHSIVHDELLQILKCSCAQNKYYQDVRR